MTEHRERVIALILEAMHTGITEFRFETHQQIAARAADAIAALTPPTLGGWQDIADAPKDGTPILAASVNHDQIEVVCWQDGEPSGSLAEVEEGWVNNGAQKDRFYANPRWFTLWQPIPLPAPPGAPEPAGERDLDTFAQGYVGGLFASLWDPRLEASFINWPGSSQRRTVSFSDLAPETRARIVEDCAAYQARFSGNLDGADFWRQRQYGGFKRRGFPPTTPHLGDDGLIYLRDAAAPSPPPVPDGVRRALERLVSVHYGDSPARHDDWELARASLSDQEGSRG